MNFYSRWSNIILHTILAATAIGVWTRPEPWPQILGTLFFIQTVIMYWVARGEANKADRTRKGSWKIINEQRVWREEELHKFTEILESVFPDFSFQRDDCGRLSIHSIDQKVINALRVETRKDVQ